MAILTLATILDKLSEKPQNATISDAQVAALASVIISRMPAQDNTAVLAGLAEVKAMLSALVAPSDGSAPVVTDSNALPPINLAGMSINGWSAPWTARESTDSIFGVLPFKFDHVVARGTDAVLVMDAKGSGHLQAQDGTPIYSDGLWETSVTLPTMRDGVDTAAFYLYADGNGDELDFEFFGRLGLFVTVHAGGKATKSIKVGEAADFDGRTVRFGIRVDQANGVISMLIDGAEVHRFVRGATFAEDGVTPVWPTTPMKAHYDMEPATPAQDSWLGHWAGFTSDTDRMEMVVHGYRHSA